MFENINKKKNIFIAIIICIILIIGGVWCFIEYNESSEYVSFEENEFDNILQNTENNEIIDQIQKIMIDISGQVVSPGVITLEEGSRLIDAINLAGGTTKDANLTKVNLAYILSDAQKIYIPSVNDDEEIEYVSDGNMEGIIITSEVSNQTNSKDEKLMININTASEKELESLPGIGSSIASRIVTYRKKNGKFNSIEDIKNVSGIGESKFNNIQNYIYVK